MSIGHLPNPNLSSVRWVKSSQGSRRGTCGWITSFFIFNVGKFVFHFYIFYFQWARSLAVERRPCMYFELITQNIRSKAEVSGSKWLAEMLAKEVPTGPYHSNHENYKAHLFTK